MIRPLRFALIGLLAPATGFVVGCASNREDELRLGGVVPIPTLTPETPAPFSEKASLTSVSRESWTMAPVLVPVDSAYLAPGQSWAPGFLDPSPRERGDFPTPETALDLDDAGFDQDMLTLAEPFWAAADLIALIPRFFLGPETDADGKPLDWRERAPAEDSLQEMQLDPEVLP